MNNDASRIVDDIIRREGHTIYAKSSQKMSSTDVKNAVDSGRLIKVASVHNLYKDAETGEFWKALDDGTMIRNFKENGGIAQFGKED